jgi:Secretion system C-terminal sorting domain
MKKIKLTLFALTLFSSIGWSQCINTTAYGSATISTCSSGQINACNWALEYSQLTFNITGNFIFTSSIPTDYLTLTTAANVVIASGTQPLTATIPSTGGYRLHVSTNSACGTDQTCRVTSYSCLLPCSGTPVAGTTVPSFNGVCTPTAVSFYLSGTSAVTGLTYQWQTSPNGSTWTNAASTIATYTQVVSASTFFRCIVACGSFTSASTSVLVSYGGVPNGGTTNQSQSLVCSGSFVNFNLIGSSNWAGLTYQWESSNTFSGGYTNIAGQTSSTMVKQINASKYDRCILTCGTSTAASSSILITVAGSPTAGTTISSGSPACGGGATTFSLSGASSTFGTGYQWQSSPNGTTWSNLVGKIQFTTTESVTTSTYYRCLLSCGTSTAASTALYVPITSGAVSYASVPYYQTFDNVWQNGCALRDVPDNLHSKNTPSTGDNSWRRQNDGTSAAWVNPLAGNNSPHSGSGCANFHSFQAANNTTGDLDFYVDMNQNGKYALSFYYINPTGTDGLDVLLSTNGGGFYSVKGSYVTQTSWNKKTIYFNAPNSANCIIRFRGDSDSGNDDIGIDSLSVKLLCLNPTISAIASTTNICSGQSLTLTATGATNYTWSPTGSTSPSIVVSPAVNTNYIATGSNDGLCFPTALISVSVTICNGLEEFYGTIASVYPNPANTILKVKLNDAFLNVTFVVYDTFGKIVLKQELKETESILNIENLANGLYYYKLVDSSKTLGIGKLVKQ